MAKLQIQQTFSHKQKTYWLISEEIERAMSYLHITNKDTIDTAKAYWHKYMDSGKLTRASVRKGLIAACLFYSCTTNNSRLRDKKLLKHLIVILKHYQKVKKYYLRYLIQII